MKFIRSSTFAVALLAFAGSAYAALAPFQTYTGNVGLSTDGFGSTTNSGFISASVPAGSTVLAAYLYSATWGSSPTPVVTLDGTAVTFGPSVVNTSSSTLASYRADVTSIVSPIINGGAGGIYNFAVTENLSTVDGEALVIVYSNASLADATVAILDGFASVTGDTATLNFADPLDPTDPAFFAEMRLGIGFSCCSQQSSVDVNGNLLTTAAGNNDDSADASLSNGNLITVGGFDDPFSPSNPSYAADHERYDLRGAITAGDTSIVVTTSNPSRDDNIFLATFWTAGFAGVNEPPPSNDVPEPGTMGLLGVGFAGALMARRRRRQQPS